MSTIKQVFLTLCILIGLATEAYAQKWAKVTCYPGIQLTLDTTLWEPQYEFPVHTDLFGAQLPIASKEKDPKEILIYSFHRKEEGQSLKQAFMTHFPKKAMGLTEFPDINGFTILKNFNYTYIALKQFSPTQVAMVVFVAPNQKEKKSIKEFSKLLNDAHFLSLEEMDAVSGYPNLNYAKDVRSQFFSKRTDRDREFKNSLVYVNEYMHARWSTLSYDATIDTEKGFSFVEFDKERQRLNKGEFTEQECLDMNFLPRKKWRSFLYWELNNTNTPGYQSEFDFNNVVLQSSLRYGIITGDTLSFKISNYPKELPWKHLEYHAFDFSRKGIYYRFGRTSDAIHVFAYRQDNSGMWQKKHTQLNRPFPNVPYMNKSHIGNKGVMIDPDLVLYDAPWSSSQRYALIADNQNRNGQLLLRKFPSYYVMEQSEDWPVSAVDYLPKERSNSLFIFPILPVVTDYMDYNSLHGNFVYGESGPYLIVLTDMNGNPVSDEEWTIEELEKELSKIKAEKRFYFTGFYQVDLNADRTNELISGWFNAGNLNLNPFFGIDANNLTQDQLKRVFNALNQSNLVNTSKEVYDPRFKNIMNKEEYDAYLASKYVLGDEDLIATEITVEGDDWGFAPVEEVPVPFDAPVSFAHEMPVYPGGESVLYQDIAKNIQYPKEMEEANIQGKVYVSIVVERDGSLTDVHVIRGVNGGSQLDREAVRAVKSLTKKFSPGKMNGKPVRVQMNIPVNFVLK